MLRKKCWQIVLASGLSVASVTATPIYAGESALTQNNADLKSEQSRQRADYIREHYSKFEYRIPMRDGTLLFTSIYIPNDASSKKTYPILMVRTPYSVAPYGANQYKQVLGPTADDEKEAYIFVFQDVRGKYLSEGEFVNMRPHIDHKHSNTDVDESSDTYDTIDWLVKHLPNNNGKVGQWGISYPVFLHPGRITRCLDGLGLDIMEFTKIQNSQKETSSNTDEYQQFNDRLSAQ